MGERMNNYRILTVVGARPQFIKASVVSQAIRDWAVERLTEVLLHTGQHYDFEMSQIFFDGLNIQEPDIHLECGGGSHNEQLAKMLTGIDSAIEEIKPDAVMVYGDTNSTLAGALAASKRNVPLIHVEAGCRSFNRDMPEESNRVVADALSQILFCASTVDLENLQREGIGKAPRQGAVLLVGDVMRDIAVATAAEIKEPSEFLTKLGLEPGRYLYATVHRSENTDDPTRLEGIFSALSELAGSLMPIVLPLHPRTRKMLKTYFHSVPRVENLHLVDPVSYRQSIELAKYSAAVMTDSGGLQKEAYYLRKYCVTLRDETEWVQLVNAGLNRLSGVSKESIIRNVREAVATAWPRHVPQLYGGNVVAPFVVEGILNELDRIYGVKVKNYYRSE